MDLKLVNYGIYLLLSGVLTVWVARALAKNGQVFLADVLDGNEKLAESVNRLLVVGFYLLNLGFVSFALRSDTGLGTATEAIEQLSAKMGVVLLVLGAVHLGNLFILSRMRRRRIRDRDHVGAGRPQQWPALNHPGAGWPATPMPPAPAAP
jgi:hypothetical protein